MRFRPKRSCGFSEIRTARLLALEVAAVQERRLQNRIRFASFPAPWRLEDFDFDAQPSVDRKLVEELASLRFLEDAAKPRTTVGVRERLRQLDVLYECGQCGERYLNERRCESCNRFCARVGAALPCPHCDEPILLADILSSRGEEVADRV